MTKTTEEIKVLIKANRWQDIATAPRDEAEIVLIKYFIEGWEEVAITAWSERFECWQLEIKNPYATIGYIGWRPLPTDDLADAAEQLLAENARLRELVEEILGVFVDEKNHGPMWAEHAACKWMQKARAMGFGTEGE